MNARKEKCFNNGFSLPLAFSQVRHYASKPWKADLLMVRWLATRSPAQILNQYALNEGIGPFPGQYLVSQGLRSRIKSFHI
jgi:hypothetical protein